METKEMTARPSMPSAAALSVLPAFWQPTAAVAGHGPLSASLTCGHPRQAHEQLVGLLAGSVTGAATAGVGATGGEGFGSGVGVSGGNGIGGNGIGGNGRTYQGARHILAMSEVVSAKPAAARLRRGVDVASGVPPRGRPD